MEEQCTFCEKKNSNDVYVLSALIGVFLSVSFAFGFSALVEKTFHEYSDFYEIFLLVFAIAAIALIVCVVFWIRLFVKKKKSNDLPKFLAVKSIVIAVIALVFGYLGSFLIIK